MLFGAAPCSSLGRTRRFLLAGLAAILRRRASTLTVRGSGAAACLVAAAGLMCHLVWSSAVLPTPRLTRGSWGVAAGHVWNSNALFINLKRFKKCGCSCCDRCIFVDPAAGVLRCILGIRHTSSAMPHWQCPISSTYCRHLPTKTSPPWPPSPLLLVPTLYSQAVGANIQPKWLARKAENARHRTLAVMPDNLTLGLEGSAHYPKMLDLSNQSSASTEQPPSANPPVITARSIGRPCSLMAHIST